MSRDLPTSKDGDETVNGIVGGLSVASVAGRLISGILFGVQPTAPSALIGSIVILTLAAAIGDIAPTVASLKTDPRSCFAELNKPLAGAWLIELRKALLLSEYTRTSAKDPPGITRLRFFAS